MLQNKAKQIFVIDESTSNHVTGKIYKSKAAYDAAVKHDLMSKKSVVFHLGNLLSNNLKEDVPKAGETTFQAHVRVAEAVISGLASDNQYQFQKHDYVEDNGWEVVAE